MKDNDYDQPNKPYKKKPRTRYKGTLAIHQFLMIQITFLVLSINPGKSRIFIYFSQRI